MSTTNETNPGEKSEILTRLLYLFTRTPLHVGAGASVGAIDLPVQRERHTGFPVLPASSLKGTFADVWNEELRSNKKDELVRILTKGAGEPEDYTAPNLAWLFGSDDANDAWAGAVQFSEAKLLAFPLRSARGSFAWITCPLILRRALRDGVLKDATGDCLAIADEAFSALQGETGDQNALLALDGPLALRPPEHQAAEARVVLEEYTFTHRGELPAGVGGALQGLLPDDPVWKEVASRLVILSDGMMSFFARNACEVAQHVCISDETGAAKRGGLFDQENVPSETLFYSVVHFFQGRGRAFKDKTPDQACKAFQGQDEHGVDRPGKPGVRSGAVLQFGGDATTGLGWCTIHLHGSCSSPESAQS
jgi:CRISPR-associated protein Cmr4